ncbi:uncharacterized protein Z518_01151 [Rhinocladiella mackenziei CBS 650.93]|uniref:glucose oxidase n=1 Tax=Rhinocladiella mackenziei CBS 650.93 TaxID=1442369 RepID=A0A0D2JKU5_9EURO|nr:uncharacterized protein Z518_01151 [Rhinocladiella mackenziei CBS 650.93]KIX10070.1 hypothetical protein Z518_01151 [Rhinocladiella mackenziei CBS 650.93]
MILIGTDNWSEGMWAREHKAEYDDWGEVLLYFKKAETIADPGVDTSQHGVDGPIISTGVWTTGRHFPLREPIRKAWAELGVSSNPDPNRGDLIGVGEVSENRKNGLRQISSSAYSLKGVTVFIDTLVKRVLISKDGETLRATGIECASGSAYLASKEVILSAGAYRTPQLLMLSGLGPKDHLASNSIETVLDLPDKAIERDEGRVPTASHPLLKTTRAFIGTLITYAVAYPLYPVNGPGGSHITTLLMAVQLTSKGSVRLASAGPIDSPLIDPNLYATEVDRYAIRQGVRDIAKLLLETTNCKRFVLKEKAPDSFPPLLANASDADIDARIAHSAISFCHPMGSAAMGKVVDNNLHVKGVEGLRVVYASVIPVAISAALQQAV